MLKTSTCLTNGQSVSEWGECIGKRIVGKSGAVSLGDPSVPLAMCNWRIFVINLLLIPDMFSEPWHLVSHSLMGKTEFK